MGKPTLSHGSKPPENLGGGETHGGHPLPTYSLQTIRPASALPLPTPAGRLNGSSRAEPPEAGQAAHLPQTLPASLPVA